MCTYVCACPFACVCLCLCMCACLYMCLHTYVCTSVGVCVHMYDVVCVCMWMCVWMHGQSIWNLDHIQYLIQNYWIHVMQIIYLNYVDWASVLIFVAVIMDMLVLNSWSTTYQNWTNCTKVAYLQSCMEHAGIFKDTKKEINYSTVTIYRQVCIWPSSLTLCKK